jgi:hypothetical protein
MRSYTVTAPLLIPAGAHLGLTPRQAGVRAHLLRPLGGKAGAEVSHFEVFEAIQFKAGEVIRSEQTLPKALASLLTDTKPAKAAA